MFVARILYPVKVLGPGRRIGIWFDGCPHRCDGCSNPELWEFDSRYEINLETLMELINNIVRHNVVDGFTLTGGDPFYQPFALQQLLSKLKNISSDILVYTGYQYQELAGKYEEALEQIAVLIDGEYIKTHNNGAVLRGSDNQRILILNPEYEEVYREYVKSGKNEIQNFQTRDGVISVGIHRMEYEEALSHAMKMKGLTIDE